jgi:hypothetical protein
MRVMNKPGVQVHLGLRVYQTEHQIAAKMLQTFFGYECLSSSIHVPLDAGPGIHSPKKSSYLSPTSIHPIKFWSKLL